jgi:hypothetical protein
MLSIQRPSRELSFELSETHNRVTINLKSGSGVTASVAVAEQRFPRQSFTTSEEEIRAEILAFLARERQYGTQSEYGLLLQVRDITARQYARQAYEIRKLVRKVFALALREEVAVQLLLEKGHSERQTNGNTTRQPA